ncbi:molybdate ABC transporter substrate-binding protein [Jatrophihabitans telluris]|uniref:Molybdate ABC transporter substrate-binding protein n=1 Tax=Jatrophihabitans telluris TaxID=2038343 RepID=A0ABY4QUT1_9ACTN|nr:molybdate ABC transporter substrate-binding protein [Jatrophihabitans telluris]UQX86832.1 molybdate ABC transporter substrate-binding protein [Jatrophihabitans telluris]
MKPLPRLLVPVLTAAAIGIALVGCSSSNKAATGAAGSTSAATAVTGTITVFAAASLTGTFTELGTQFQNAHPGTTVKFNFGGSSALAEQINSGAPGDVFASAAPKNMTTVTAKNGTSAQPVNFATNKLEVAVPPANPGKVSSLSDLAKSGVKVALCQAQVPCGAAALTVLQKNNLAVTPVTEEPDVKSVLTKVQLGEVDAGVVYVTDVKAAAAKVTGVEIPDAQNTISQYPIAPLTESKNATTAKAFVDFVTSAGGQAILHAAGFGKP